jgi:hypothetical protein
MKIGNYRHFHYEIKQTNIHIDENTILTVAEVHQSPVSATEPAPTQPYIETDLVPSQPYTEETSSEAETYEISH